MIPDLVSNLFQRKKFKLDLIQSNTFKPSINIFFCINTNLDFGSITPQTLVCLTLLIKLKLALRKDYSQVWF